MKKILAILFAAALVLTLFGCQAEEEPAVTVTRSFVAGYEDEAAGLSGRVLLNLMSDGTAEFYVGALDHGEHRTAQYAGTYTLGENEEFDETISLTYPHGQVTDAVIVDSIFETPFYLLDEMTAGDIKFYETSPAAMDGDVYVGYLTKTGGMGAMVYAYALCLRDDMTFDVSIMQMASVMHVWGGTGGTYTVDGENITFTYDILSTEGRSLPPMMSWREPVLLRLPFPWASTFPRQPCGHPVPPSSKSIKENHYGQSKTGKR